jgi:hypothetical protein
MGNEVLQKAKPGFSDAQLRGCMFVLSRYYSHKQDYLEICRSYQAIYETASVKEDPSQWIPVNSFT